MLKTMRLPTQLLQRKVKSHKGDYGHILILAGSSRYSGAALLCAEAALRAGAGLVTLGTPKSICLALIRKKAPEIMTLPLPETNDGTLSLAAFTKIYNFLKYVDVLIIGPGLGKNKSTYALIRKIIKKIKLPTVIDADALSALNNHLEALKTHKGQLILTPHQMEMSKLFSINLNFIKKNRKLIAKKCAKHYNSVIILKGHNSVVTNVSGHLYINKSGNPGMATAGSGDVLSGIAGAFLAQGLDAFRAAKYATYIHGLAGDIAAKDKTQMGLIASDIINRIPDAIKKSS
ncbi:MAG: NAD(P)H-hydrate dehydratase [Candidatus Omnitrophota bacterium]|nr:NAD(P)H-hydrate dehydratase [Candidatus Omnitrophota bacterium]